MKIKLLLLLCVVLLSGSTALAGRRIDPSALPQKAQTFLNTHFNGIDVIKAEQDKDLFGTDYEVDLSNGAEVEFDGNGEWTQVKMRKRETVPSAIIPTAIINYVNKNFKGLGIRKIEKERHLYEIELTNGVEYHISGDAKTVHRHYDD